MTTLEVLSVLFATAAIFGLISTRWLKLPVTVGTMLLTVVISPYSCWPRRALPAIHQWAPTLLLHIDFESIILHGMLPLLLFAGAFLLDLEQLAQEKLTVSLALHRGYRHLCLSPSLGSCSCSAAGRIAVDAVPHLRRAHLAH